MNGKLLLDTNAVISVFASDAGVLSIVSSTAECFLPVIVLGELFYGAQHSAKTEENVKRIQSFCSTLAVLSCDSETASQYGRIKNHLRRKGRPIPENDIWVAAIAAQHQLSLMSRDEHFDDVDGITRIAW